MKRDMDLIRLLLLEAEGSSSGPESPPFDRAIILEHRRLLIERGLAEGEISEVKGSARGQVVTSIVHVRIDRLTWDGHDFLAAARDEALWKKTWSKIKEKGTDVSFDVLGDLLKSGIKQAIGIP